MHIDIIRLTKNLLLVNSFGFILLLLKKLYENFLFV